MKIKNVFGSEDIEIKDFHSDPVDGFYLYPKLIPSSIRQRILLECQRTKQSELKVMVNILIENFEG